MTGHDDRNDPPTSEPPGRTLAEVFSREDDLTPVERPVRQSRGAGASSERRGPLPRHRPPEVNLWLAREPGRMVTFAVRAGRGLAVYVFRTEDDPSPVVEYVSPVEDPMTAVLRAISVAGP